MVRAVADGAHPSQTQLGDVVTEGAETVTPDTNLDDVVTIMRMKAFAIERDRDEALADISAAEPNT